MASSAAPQYLNWPDPIESKLPYVAPPKGANPVVRGAALKLGAPLVHKFPSVAKFLYNNAGFSRLRRLPNFENVKCRYDPTVVPLVNESERVLIDHTDPASVSPNQLDAREDGKPLFWGIRDYHKAYQSGEITPVDVVNALLPLIRRDIENRSEHSTAFLTTKVELVTKAAEASAARWKAGKPLGLLDGVPVAIKDEIDLAEYVQTLGMNRINRTSAETSWCVKKWEEKGAIVVGKTNMHEVGMDTTNNNSFTGTPLNPYNDSYYTGGSSGGSGYVVATGLVPFAQGNGMSKLQLLCSIRMRC